MNQSSEINTSIECQIQMQQIEQQVIHKICFSFQSNNFIYSGKVNSDIASVLNYMAQYQDQANNLNLVFHKFDKTLRSVSIFQKLYFYRITITKLKYLALHLIFLLVYFIDQMFDNYDTKLLQKNSLNSQLVWIYQYSFLILVLTNYILFYLVNKAAGLFLIIAVLFVWGLILLQQTVLQDIKLSVIIMQTFLPFSAALLILVVNYCAKLFKALQTFWLQVAYLSLYYLFTLGTKFYLIFTTSQNILQLIFVFRILLLLISSLTGIFLAKQLFYDDLRNLKRCIKNISHKSQNKVYFKEYAKPKYIVAPNLIAILILSSVVITAQSFLLFSLNQRMSRFQTFFYVGLSIFIPLWLSLGNFIKDEFIQYNSQQHLKDQDQFSDNQSKFKSVIILFLLIVVPPIVVFYFKDSLYDQPKYQQLAVYFYILPVSCLYWFISCQFVVSDRKKFLFCSALGLLILFPIIGLLPLSFYNQNVVLKYITWVLLGISCLIISSIFIYKSFKLFWKMLKLQSLKEFRRRFNNFLNKHSSYVKVHYRIISSISLLIMYSMSFFIYTSRAEIKLGENQGRNMLFCAVFSSLLFLSMEILNRIKFKQIKILYVGAILAISLLILLTLLLVGFFINSLKNQMILVADTFLFAVSLSLLLAWIRSKTNQKIVLLIQIILWLLVLCILFASISIYSTRNSLDLKLSKLIQTFVYSYLTLFFIIVTLIGCLVHILLNLSQQFRKFIVLQDLLTHALKPMKVFPDQSAVTEVIHLIDQSMTLQKIQKALIECKRFQISNGEQGFRLQVSEQKLKGTFQSQEEYIVKQKQKQEKKQINFTIIKQHKPISQKLKYFRIKKISQAQIDQIKRSDSFNAIRFSQKRRIKFLSGVWSAFTSQQHQMIHSRDFSKIIYGMFNIQPLVLDSLKNQLSMLVKRQHHINRSDFCSIIYKAAKLIFQADNKKALQMLIEWSYPTIFGNMKTLGLQNFGGPNETSVFYTAEEMQVQKKKLDKLIEKKSMQKQMYLEYIIKSNQQSILKKYNENKDPDQKVDQQSGQQINANTIRKVLNQKPPSWQLVCNKIAYSCLQMHRQILTKRDSALDSINFSMSNIIMIVTKLSDYISIFCQVPLNVLIKQLTDSIKVTAITYTFDYYYGVGLWVSIFLALLYFYIVYLSIQDLKKGTVGLNQNGQTSNLTQLKYWYSLLLNLLSNTFCVRAIRYCLFANICYLNSEGKLFLQADPTTQCMNQFHLAQIIISLLILVTYYPLAMVISPITINVDRSLTIKYKTQFSVIYMQCKIILISVEIFVRYRTIDQYILWNTSVGLLISLFLALLFWRTKPCLIQIVNSLQLIMIIVTVGVNASSFLFLYELRWGYVGVCSSMILISFGLVLYRYLFRANKVGISDQDYINNVESKQSQQQQRKQILRREKEQSQRILQKQF